MVRIAIVDDSRIDRRFAATCLTWGGFEVDEIDPWSLDQVIQTLSEAPPDLLLLDAMIPFCGGDLIARVCRDLQALRKMRILVYTAHPDEQVLPRFGGIEVEGFIRKPCRPKHMLDTVQRLVAHPALGS